MGTAFPLKNAAVFITNSEFWLRQVCQMKNDKKNAMKKDKKNVKSSQVKSSQVKSSQVKSSQVKSSQVKSSQVKSSQVKSSQVKSSQVKSSQVKSRNVNIPVSVRVHVSMRKKVSWLSNSKRINDSLLLVWCVF